MALKEFKELVEEAWTAPFSGWDFSWLRGRQISLSPSWDYIELAMARMSGMQSLLDMDTGGGELLSKLGPFPPQTYAVEGYPPNVPIARARLEPLGIHLFAVESNDNLPFPAGQFDLVLNRHGSYSPAELTRILRTGGVLLTQQVGGNNQFRLNELLQENPLHPYAFWTLAYAQSELEAAGFKILRAKEEFPETCFYDVGAVVYYLKAIPWQIEGFEPGRFLARLALIDEIIRREGRLVTHQHNFLIEARKP